MNAKTGADFEALKYLLEKQQAEIARLLEKVSHLENMVLRRGSPCIQLQPRMASSAKSIPRRWCVRN